DGYLNVMGYDPESFYKEAAGLFGRLPVEDREYLLKACQRVAAGTGDNQLLVLRRARAHGGEALLSIRARLLGARNGHPLLCLGFNDITSSRLSMEMVVTQQRQMLGRHAQFLERLYRTIPCGIVELRMDDELVFSSANRAACDIFGYANEEEFRRGFSLADLDWVFPADRANVAEMIRNFLAAPSRVPYEHRIVRQDGTVAWLKGTIDAVLARDGRQRLQNVFLDVTEEKDEKRTLQLIMENLPVGVGIFQMGERQEPVYLSGQLWEIFGLDPNGYAELCRAGGAFAFLPPSGTLGLERLRQGAAELPFEQVYRAARRDGRPLWLRVVGQARLDDNGHTVVYASIVDITERIAEERKMAKQDELYKLLMEDSQMLIFDYDPETRLMEYSLMLPDHRRAQRQIAGYLDQLPHSATLHPDSREPFAERLRAAELAPARDTFEYRADYFGRGYAWYRCLYKSLADATGRVFRVVGRSFDITAEIEQAAALRAKAATDAMSGLYNRAMTEELINSRLQALAPGEKCFLMIIDIDRFKSINDTLGHPTGDRVIKSIAAVLRAQFRAEDVVGRIGGDEFAVLVRTGAVERVHERVDAILHAVRALSQEMALGVAFSSSIGVAEAPRDGRAFDTLFPNADRALYQAKQRGKDCGVFFDPAMAGGGE
ncbi:MAG: diguanylate cyclase, partial [Planctomycetes bacterium]|nr:diguanylate cyclase [Planctomycetota bacterium]